MSPTLTKQVRVSAETMGRHKSVMVCKQKERIPAAWGGIIQGKNLIGIGKTVTKEGRPAGKKRTILYGGKVLKLFNKNETCEPSLGGCLVTAG